MSAVKRFTWESLPPASLRLSGLYSLPVFDPCRIQLPILGLRTSCHLHSGTSRAFQIGCEKRVIGPTVCREAGRIIWIYIFPCLFWFGAFARWRETPESFGKCKCQSSPTDRSWSSDWKNIPCGCGTYNTLKFVAFFMLLNCSHWFESTSYSSQHSNFLEISYSCFLTNIQSCQIWLQPNFFIRLTPKWKSLKVVGSTRQFRLSKPMGASCPGLFSNSCRLPETSHHHHHRKLAQTRLVSPLMVFWN